MGNRVFKQLIYGFGYLAVFFSLLFIFYLLFLKPAPVKTCANSNMDCSSGVCIPCEIANLSPLEQGAMKYFSFAGKTIFVVKIKNSNLDYGADNFSYTFNILGKTGEKIKGLSGASFVYAADEKYILEMADIDPAVVGSVNFNFGETSWKLKEKFQKPRLTILNRITQKIEGGQGVEVAGIIANESASRLAKVNAIGFVKNSDGVKIGASQTELDNFEPQGSRPFRIIFPPNISLLTATATAASFFNVNLADPDKTEIYIDGR